MHNADWAAPRFIAFKAMPCTQSLPPDSERRKFSRAPALPTALPKVQMLLLSPGSVCRSVYE